MSVIQPGAEGFVFAQRLDRVPFPSEDAPRSARAGERLGQVGAEWLSLTGQFGWVEEVSERVVTVFLGREQS